MSLTCALPPNWSKVVEDAPIEAANCIRMVKSRPWLLTSMVCSLRNLLALKKKAITKFDVHDKALMTPDGPSYSFWPLSSAYSGEASDAVAQVLLEVDFDLSDSVIIAELKLHLRTLREKLTRRVSNTKVEASKKDSLRDPGSWTLLKCIALFRLNKCFKSRRKAIAWCEKQVDDLPDDLKKSYNWSRSIAKVVKMFCEEVAGWPNEPGAT